MEFTEKYVTVVMTNGDVRSYGSRDGWELAYDDELEFLVFTRGDEEAGDLVTEMINRKHIVSMDGECYHK